MNGHRRVGEMEEEANTGVGCERNGGGKSVDNQVTLLARFTQYCLCCFFLFRGARMVLSSCDKVL